MSDRTKAFGDANNLLNMDEESSVNVIYTWRMARALVGVEAECAALESQNGKLRDVLEYFLSCRTGPESGWRISASYGGDPALNVAKDKALAALSDTEVKL